MIVIRHRFCCNKKQEAHGPHSSPDKTVQIIKQISLKRKKKLYETLLVLHLKTFEFPSPKDALCQVWIKLAQWFWRRRFFNFVNVFSLFQNYLPLEKGRALHLNKVVPSLVEIGSVVLGWECFNFVNVFSLFLNYLSWKRVSPYIWIN